MITPSIMASPFPLLMRRGSPCSTRGCNMSVTPASWKARAKVGEPWCSTITWRSAIFPKLSRSLRSASKFSWSLLDIKITRHRCGTPRRSARRTCSSSFMQGITMARLRSTSSIEFRGMTTFFWSIEMFSVPSPEVSWPSASSSETKDISCNFTFPTWVTPGRILNLMTKMRTVVEVVVRSECI